MHCGVHARVFKDSYSGSNIAHLSWTLKRSVLKMKHAHLSGIVPTKRSEFNQMHNADPINDTSIRRTANWLGYGGLIPFLVLTPASLFDAHHAWTWSDALFAYGAVILSFIGALHWGFAMALPGLDASRRVRTLIWSVVPALIAWPALLLAPAEAAALMVIGFVLHYVQDRRLARIAALPSWYLPLRLRLSAVACISLSLGSFVRL